MINIAAFIAGFKLGVRDFWSLWTIQSWLGGWLVRIVSNILVWVYLGNLTNSPAHFQYLLIGNCATAGLGNFAVVVPSWERMNGTFPLLVARPGPIWTPIVGRMSVWAVSWYATAVICLILGMLFLDLPILKFTSGLMLLAILAIMCLSTLTFCAFLGAMVCAAPKFRLIAGWGVLTGIMAFTGVATPIDFWPNWLQPILELLPVTNGLAAFRTVISEGISWNAICLSAREMLVGGLWMILASLAFNIASVVLRRNGRIELAD